MNPMSRWIMVLMLSICSSAGATKVPYLPLSEFGRVDAHQEPKTDSLNPSERELLRAAVRELGPDPFPQYLYSGCQDRAQAAYMLMPDALKPKIMKIWVITPAVYTAGMRGWVRPAAADPKLGVNWGHHVALAFRENGKLKVYDPVLKAGKIMNDRDWLKMLDASPRSFWTLTNGSVYLFYDRPLAESDFAVNSSVWTGFTSDYSGKFRTENWVPANIARDAVGVDAAVGRSCRILNNLARDPIKLLNRLNAPTPADEQNCAPSLAQFRSVKNAWIDRLAAR